MPFFPLGSVLLTSSHLLANAALQARVKELEHQLREKQVENVYLRGEISGLKNNNPQHLHSHVLHDDRDSK